MAIEWPSRPYSKSQKLRELGILEYKVSDEWLENINGKTEKASTVVEAEMTPDQCKCVIDAMSALTPTSEGMMTTGSAAHDDVKERKAHDRAEKEKAKK